MPAFQTNAPIQFYHHGRFRVAGGVLPDAITAYQTFGDKTKPCIVFPTCYGAKLDDQVYMIGEEKPPPHNGPYFPAISYDDNIRAQYTILTKVLGIENIYAVIGFSMGAQQAYYWPVMYPDYVERQANSIMVYRDSFLEGPKAALTASKDFDNGHYKAVPQIGIRAFGRAYSAWAYGQTWFRNHGYLHEGKYADLDSFLREEWEAGFLNGWDANDLLTLLDTWYTGDVSQVRDGGDYEACLKAIKARGLIMPSKTDLYFPPEDSEGEISHLKDAKLVVIDSVWGHMAGGGSNTQDDEFIKKEHGRFRVAGGVLPNAITAYRTYGNPGNPCIVFPTCYGAKLGLGSQDYLIGEDKALDTRKYFVVGFALFSNGESSSPSNTPKPHNGPYFPTVSCKDNIQAQHAVLTKRLDVKKLHCVIGFSMGGQQAYHWASMYPDFVERFIVICSSARTSPHNKCFLEGPKAALVASKDFDNGHYNSSPQHGIRAFARVYSAWAYGQAWFREHNYLYNGLFPDMNSWLSENWEGKYLAHWDANDMLVLLNTWQNGDISQVKNDGDLEAALKSITAKALIMPCKTDLYFPPEDSKFEVSYLRNAQLAVIPSVWGHVAGGGGNPTDVAFISEKIREFLND
ncbi:Alpha/Beta hydrolase protein [Phellopilus nigrolimitatus]|nr:Alpha/Beta hydrolase protein [Phellopilus nigrolimitatus]